MSQLRVHTVGIVAAENQSTTSWIPSQRSNLALWFDASDAATVHATTGSVDTWDDKSGNGRNATALTTARPTTGTRTQNSRNVFDFDGATDIMATSSFSMAQNFTLAVVFKNDDGANSTQQPILTDVTNGRGIQKSDTNVWRLYDGASLDDGAVNTSAHYIIGLCKASPNAVINVDGSETTGGVGSGSLAGGMHIGGHGANFWDGWIAEIVIYSNEVNSTDRATLGTYFDDKWGV